MYVFIYIRNARHATSSYVLLIKFTFQSKLPIATKVKICF